MSAAFKKAVHGGSAYAVAAGDFLHRQIGKIVAGHGGGFPRWVRLYARHRDSLTAEFEPRFGFCKLQQIHDFMRETMRFFHARADALKNLMHYVHLSSTQQARFPV